MNIEEYFTYHKPDDEDIRKYYEIREKAKELAYLIVKECPKGKESGVALDKLKEGVMWANASIALKHLSEEA